MTTEPNLTPPPQEQQTPSTSPTSGSNAPQSLLDTNDTPPTEQGWVEYVPDPAKSDEENAAAKAEHDKTKPAEGAKQEAPKVEPVTADAIKLPEGFEVDDATMTPFLALINDQNLSRAELAQKLVDLQTQSFKTADEARSKAWSDMVAAWQDEVRNDPEVGGAKFQASIAAGNKVINQFGDATLRELCATTGIGNNVSFIRFLNKVAARVLEPGVVSGAPAASAPKSQAEILFPNMGKTT